LVPEKMLICITPLERRGKIAALNVGRGRQVMGKLKPHCSKG
jgi:hypothetical protein